ncbi:hypothetical protein D3C77_213110 [compost metagenome]
MVEPGSDAAAAGLQAGDLIVEADGAAVADLAALARRLGQPGAANLTVLRDGERLEAALPAG